jgi:hypothetical protein
VHEKFYTAHDWGGHDFTPCGKTPKKSVALKGRGFSLALNLEKMTAALAAENYFFRSLFGRAADLAHYSQL